MEYILRGKTFYPDEAFEIGLVNQVVEGDVLETALVMAGEFDDKPPRALAAIKQAVKASWGKTTLDGVLEEGDLFADLIATDDQAVKMMEDYVANGHVFKKI
jgi:enoyl-CoA hydratase